jgi:hypothetical protein
MNLGWRMTGDSGRMADEKNPRDLSSLACHRAFALFALVVAVSSCGPSLPNTDMRAWTDSFEMRIRSDVIPPRALEQIHYTITVRDIKTHEPIANGQGRIFATNADGHTVYDGFAYGPEVGTYHATILFPTSGDWAMNVQFRLDSTKALQKPDNDWRQTVNPASEPGSDKP